MPAACSRSAGIVPNTSPLRKRIQTDDAVMSFDSVRSRRSSAHEQAALSVERCLESSSVPFLVAYC